MTGKSKLDKKAVERMYWFDELPGPDIARRLGTCQSNLYHFMAVQDIPRRPRGIHRDQPVECVACGAPTCRRKSGRNGRWHNCKRCVACQVKVQRAWHRNWERRVKKITRPRGPYNKPFKSAILSEA